MKKHILILSNEEEQCVALVTKHLEKMGETFYRFDTNTFPKNKTLTMTFPDGGMCGSLKTIEHNTSNDTLINWENIKSVWYRRPALPEVKNSVREDFREFGVNESRAALWSLYTSIDARWVNPPLFASKLLEDNKLYQMKVAYSVGLRVPKTIISNNFEDILSFSSTCKNLAVKPLYTTVFRKEGEDLLFLYTNKISKKDLLEKEQEIGLCPIMLQEYTDKKIELRITIVNQEIFACAIHSQNSERTLHDWRKYDFSGVKHEQYQLPINVKYRLLKLMKTLGLYYGAVDMIITPEDEYVFLEINPNGQWGWIEELTGMQISQAIANLLAR